MGKAKDLSPSKILEVKTLLLHTKHSQRHTALLSNVSRASVDRIKKKLDANIAFTPKRVNKCGRKKITTPRDMRKIKKICVNNRKAPRALLKKNDSRSWRQYFPRHSPSTRQRLRVHVSQAS